MGRMKSLLIEREEQRGIGEKIAVMAGVLVECKTCFEICDNMTGDSKPAFMLGNRLISDGDALVKSFCGDRRTMTDAIQAAIENAGLECSCDRHAAED